MANELTNTYRRVKEFFHWVMEDPTCPYRRWYHFVMMIMVALSVSLFVWEIQLPQDSLRAILLMEIGEGFTLLFLTEYLLRWWTSTSLIADYRQAVTSYRRRVYRPQRIVEILEGLSHAALNKLRWMFQPLSLIDLLAVLPMFRIFRLMMVLQMLKFFRYSRRIAFFTGILGERRYEMTSLLLAGVVIWGTVAIAFFLTEYGVNDKLNNLGAAVYWAIITITTVGYGDIAPVTEMGRLIASVGVLTGMSITVLVTSIVVSVFTDRLFNLKEYQMEQQIERLRNHFIVCGLDVLGLIACQSLETEKKPFVAIDNDQQRVDLAIRRGWIALRGDINDAETWERAGLKRASSVISAILNEATNVYIILMVRELNPKCFVVACGGQPNSEHRLTRVGADRVVSPFQNGGQQLAQTAMRPSALQFFRFALDQAYSNLEMEEIPILPGSAFDGIPLRDSDLRHGYDAIVVGILSEDKGMIFNPRADYRMMAGNVIICLGHKDDLERLKRASRQIAVENLLEGLEIAEIWIAPDSTLDGVTLEEAALRQRFNLLVVGIAPGGKNVQFRLLPNQRLSAGDVIVCLGHREHLDLLRKEVGETAQTPQIRIGLELERLTIPVGSNMEGMLLRTSGIRRGYFCNVVAVQRPGEGLTLSPPPDYRFADKDVLICLGRREDLNNLKEKLTHK